MRYKAMTQDTYSADTLLDVLENMGCTANGMGFVGETESSWLGFAELHGLSVTLARKLIGLGLRPGDRVCLIITEPEHFVRLFLAALRAGLIAVPISAPRSIAELEMYREHAVSIVRRSGSRIVLASGALVPVLRDALSTEMEVLTPEDAWAAPDGPIPTRISAQDTAFLQFTSGTTGRPKGVVVKHGALLANASSIATRLALTSEDVGVTWLPLYHDMGLIGFVVVPLLARTTTWFLPTIRFLRRPASWLELMHRVRGSVSFAPNSAYSLIARRLNEQDVSRWDLSAWRVAGCGAEPIDPVCLKRFSERLAPAGFRPQAFVPCYGMAEATLAIAACSGLRVLAVDAGSLERDHCANEPRNGARTLELVSCGRPLEGHELRIVDAQGRELPHGCVGEIWFSGPSVAMRYHDDALASAETFDGTWLHTGDLGFLKAGELYIAGRRREVIAICGRALYPQDIERVVEGVAGVRPGCVIAFPCTAGEADALVVALELHPGCDQQRVHAQVEHAIYAVFGLKPAQILSLPKGRTPKTTSGKLRRSAVRAMHQAAAATLPALAIPRA
jgi:fatty-acyl-CoA synthase